MTVNRTRPALVSLAALLALLLLPSSARAAPAGTGAHPAASAADLGEAYRLYDAGRLEEAEAAFKALIARDPANLDAGEGLTWTYVKQGKRDRAALAADARLALAPGDQRWRRRWIEIIHQVPARREEAITAAADLARQEPADLGAQLLLARLLSWTPGHEEETVAAYRRAVAMDPADHDARLGLAQSLSFAGQLDEARDLFDALIAEDGRDAEALYGRSEIARWAGDYETANRLLRRAAAADPGDVRIRAALDAVESQARELGAARKGISRPLMGALVIFCVLLGTPSPRVTRRTYAALIAYSLFLVGLGLIYLYRYPWR